MRVLFATNIPAPYRVDFFNELSKSCDLTVLYERRTAKNRNEKWYGNAKRNYKEIFLKGLKIGEESAFCPGIKKFLKSDEYDIIILSGYATLTSIYANFYLKRKKKPFIISVDGCLKRQDTKCKYRLKSALLKNAAAVLVPGEKAAACIKDYGVATEKIFLIPFTSLKESDVLDLPITKTKKENLKSELGLDKRVITISVGNFVYGKGFDILLKATEKLNDNVSVCIVGGEPTDEYLNLVSVSGKQRVSFINFLNKNELYKYYQAADIFVLPTREDVWGLVVNEAMANALPIITTERCGAGLDLIENDVNGYIIPIDDVDVLAEKVNFLSENLEKREKMSEENLSKIRAYTIEKMAICHKRIFDELIKTDRLDKRG